VMEGQRHRTRSPWQRELRGVCVIAKKDAMIYYLKPPVLIFGVLFPIFFFLAFAVGRQVPAARVVPGMLAMAIFFTASAVGPLVTPWERRAKTYERLISSPVSALSIILGDVLAGACFGAVLSFVSLVLAAGLTSAAVTRPAVLLMGIVLSAPCFAALGALLAAPPTDNPSQVMMLANLVRLPLLFISGVFVPLAEMPPWTRPLVANSYYPLWLDVVMLAAFAWGFVVLALVFHRRGRDKGL